MKKQTLFFVFLGTLALLVARFIFLKPVGWWRFPTKGEIYSAPVFQRNTLFFGNNIGEFFAVDSKTGREKWKFRTEHEILFRPTIRGNRVLFTSLDGILFYLNAKTGDELWRFSAENNFGFYTDLVIHKNTVFVGDTNGSLYAINLKNGELRWKFDSLPAETLSSIIVGSTLNWFGGFKIKGDAVYFGSRDGNLYALSYKNGALKWKFDSGSPITPSPEVLGKKIYFGNKNGDSFALKRKDGKLVWQNRGDGKALTCIQPMKKYYPPWKTFVIEIYEDGDIVKRKGSSAEEVWRIKTESEKVRCPVNWHTNLYFGDDSGTLRAINEKNGEEIWKVDVAGGIKTSPVLKYKFLLFDLPSLRLFSNTPFVFFGDNTGKFYAINGKSGKEIWSFNSFGSINSRPIIDKDYLYFASSDGGLYKVRTLSGKIGRILGRTKLAVIQNIDNVGKNQIVELTVTSDDNMFTNPWKEVEITTEFTHESGKKINIYGFYYDKDTWKVRFNPTDKGEWTWNLQFRLPDKTLVRSGKFVSEVDTGSAFLKVSNKNPKRLTLDNEKIYNGLGLQGAIKDYNRNGTPLDDWAIGNSKVLVATSSAGTNYFRSDKIIDLETYLTTYGENGGFNLYRFGLSNASFSLWEEFGIHNKYLVRQGKWGDTFVQSLRDEGFQIWMTIFGFGIPFSETQRPIEKRALQDYIKYVVARYGVYVGIWEIANEAYISDRLVKFIADEISRLDHENRPISMSWERPGLEEIDIISPHWYETEASFLSDLRTKEMIGKYKDYQKPVVFGEQGNQKSNWDDSSAIRMRVRSWTAFFNEAILIFWNQSDRKDAFNPVLNNANIYIGEKERGYMRVLQEFTKNVDLSAKMIPLSINNSSVRSYGLRSDEGLLGYFFHHTSIEKDTSFQLPVSLPQKSSFEWVDPSTGEMVGRGQLSAGVHRLASPDFSVDLALKLVYLDN